MFAEITEIAINQEMDGYERSVFKRLLPTFNSIQQEAETLAKEYRQHKSENFNPDLDDEGNIEDMALSIELYHSELETRLRQNFLNNSAVELRHILEKQLHNLFNAEKTDGLKGKTSSNGYSISTCPEWNLLNEELRIAANSIKHGKNSPSFTKLQRQFPSLIINNEVCITENNLKDYLQAQCHQVKRCSSITRSAG